MTNKVSKRTGITIFLVFAVILGIVVVGHTNPYAN